MPSRRRLLAACSALLPALAGCQTSREFGNGEAESTTRVEATTTGDPDTETTTDTDGYTVESSLERRAYWLRGFELAQSIGGLPDDELTELSDLGSETRAAVESAITGDGYATDDPSDALLEGIDDVAFVAYQGTYYDVSHTFPTYTLELDTDIDPENAPADRTVERDSDAVRSDETVEDAVTTVTPLGTNYYGQPYVTTQFPAVLREFLDRYDYVSYPAGVGELVLSTTERSPPHSVTASEATDEQLYGRQVLELDEFTATGRELLRRTLEDRRKTPLGPAERDRSIFPDDIPDRLDGRLERESRFVRADGSIYGFSARHLHWRDLPLSVTASVVDESVTAESPARVRLEATNETEDTVELRMDGLAPFGVLWAYGPSGEHVLWTDEYERTDNVRLEGGEIFPEYSHEFGLPSDESAATTYEFGRSTDRLRPGDYEIKGFVWAKWPTEPGQEKHDWRSDIFPYALTLGVSR